MPDIRAFVYNRATFSLQIRNDHLCYRTPTCNVELNSVTDERRDAYDYSRRSRRCARLLRLQPWYILHSLAD